MNDIVWYKGGQKNYKNQHINVLIITLKSENKQFVLLKSTSSVSACRAQFARGQLVAADAASPLWTPELELVTADTDTSL